MCRCRREETTTRREGPLRLASNSVLLGAKYFLRATVLWTVVGLMKCMQPRREDIFAVYKREREWPSRGFRILLSFYSQVQNLVSGVTRCLVIKRQHVSVELKCDMMLSLLPPIITILR